MKNYSCLMSSPAVSSAHREQADIADHKRNTVRECAANGCGALFSCAGGMYGYFVAADDDNVSTHYTAAQKLLLVGEPTKELTTVREAYDYLNWDYAAEKAEWARVGADLDALGIGFVAVPEAL